MMVPKIMGRMEEIMIFKVTKVIAALAIASFIFSLFKVMPMRIALVLLIICAVVGVVSVSRSNLSVISLECREVKSACVERDYADVRFHLGYIKSVLLDWVLFSPFLGLVLAVGPMFSRLILLRKIR